MSAYAYVTKQTWTKLSWSDYEYLKDLFHACYEKFGFSYEQTGFDWSSIDVPTDVQGQT